MDYTILNIIAIGTLFNLFVCFAYYFLSRKIYKKHKFKEAYVLFFILEMFIILSQAHYIRPRISYEQSNYTLDKKVEQRMNEKIVIEPIQEPDFSTKYEHEFEKNRLEGEKSKEEWMKGE